MPTRGVEGCLEALGLAAGWDGGLDAVADSQECVQRAVYRFLVWEVREATRVEDDDVRAFGEQVRVFAAHTLAKVEPWTRSQRVGVRCLLHIIHARGSLFPTPR